MAKDKKITARSGGEDAELVGMLTAESAPTDSYNAVYLIMMLHGMGTLMPWNMFITIAPAYYAQYKFVKFDSDGVKHDTPYSLNFLSYLGLASQMPNLILNFINLFIQVKGGLARRITTSLIIISAICFITLICTLIDTNNMLSAFFYFTMLSVVILNAANGIYQNSIYGVVAALPPQYTNAIVLGNNLCGTFVSIISIITLIVSRDVKIAAFLYFLISLLTILACFGSFFILPRLPFYDYYSEKAKTKENDEVTAISSSKWDLYYEVFKKVWPQCLNVWLVFFVTLAVFPAIMADVQPSPSNGRYDFFVPEYLFTPIFTYLWFNTFAAVGSFLANFFQLPSPKHLFIPVVARLLFIPLFIFCNYRPSLRTWPIWFENHWFFIIFGFLMSLTNGYFSSVGMMYAPRSVEPSKAQVAGMMAAFFLILGVASGVTFTFFLSWFVDSAGPDAPGSFVQKL